MSDSNSSNIKTGWVLAILIGIVLLVVGFYFFTFNSHILKNENWPDIFKNLSKDTGSWGTFGDYVGGLLNPVIAAFAFYLIAKTYELQKRELEATRSLLKVSTDAQKEQIKLAALTALLNSNLMRIGMLESKKIAVSKRIPSEPRPNMFASQTTESSRITQRYESVDNELEYIQQQIYNLEDKNNKLEGQIDAFLNNKLNDVCVGNALHHTDL
jgi:hypothetical protein